MRDDESPLARSRYFGVLDSIEGIAELVPPPGPLEKVWVVYPGIAVAAIIALAATFLSQHYGAPVMLFALLIGMAFHFLHAEARCRPGIEFCARTILRIGVALLGLRITAGEIVSLGL